jgi:hypothetical protein
MEAKKFQIKAIFTFVHDISWGEKETSKEVTYWNYFVCCSVWLTITVWY